MLYQIKYFIPLLIGLMFSSMHSEAVVKWVFPNDRIPNFRAFSDVLKNDHVCHIGAANHLISGSAQFCLRNVSQLIETMNA